MRMERVSNNQFTIFLTFDDLIDRGFTRDELRYDVSITQNLFSDMMHEASAELDFELGGMLLIQVYLMQAQGMHIIVTQNNELDDDADEEFITMKVTLDERNDLIFSFDDFEDIIRVSDHLSSCDTNGGQIYYFNEKYYMILEDTDLQEDHKENIIAVLAEFASPSILTPHRLREYGKVIYSSGAIKQILRTFY
jgi:adapter protein MecA 1/2